jgi:GTP-binding protein HflX
VYRVVLVGYTNAGKSSLLNALVHADVRARNQLFATLDPTTRRLKPDSETTLLVSDTVGFIRRLPPELIEAFHSTLEEVVEADLLLVVVDSSDPACADHIHTTTTILSDIGASAPERIVVFNKCDRPGAALHPDLTLARSRRDHDLVVRCSALDGTGIDSLRDILIERARFAARVRA